MAESTEREENNFPSILLGSWLRWQLKKKKKINRRKTNTPVYPGNLSVSLKWPRPETYIPSLANDQRKMLRGRERLVNGK